MKVKNLKKGCNYYYTAGADWVKVTYKYETINGYMFTANGVDNALTAQSVEQYVEEL